MKRLYLDHAATTPITETVAEKMRSWSSGLIGNPSSLHADGRSAKNAIDEAREILASHLGALFGEITFTGSGTEASNLAIFGTAFQALASGDQRRKFVFSAAEHHCVLHTADRLRLLGFEVVIIPVDRYARAVDPASYIDENTLLVAVMHANNELGTLNASFDKKGARLLIDGVQTLGHFPLNVDELDADFLLLSAHKIGGPKGIGALYCRSGVLIEPLIVGGGQERDQRAGTESVEAIVGFGEAVRTLRYSGSEACDAFWNTVGDEVIRSVPPEIPTIGNIAHFRVPGINADNLLIKLDRLGISASSGAACSSGSIEPSHVLFACGYTEAECKQGIRFSFGSDQSGEDGVEAGNRLKQAISEINRDRGC
ncbi:MAG: cysteine desulfurase [Armatimonadetes bacterium]|nr:cysteine desulfurase [Armatimonadota bacterium]